MRKIFLIILFSQVCLSSFAQVAHQSKKAEKRKRISSLIKQEEEGVITYHHQLIFGGKLINDGYGGFIEYGLAKSVKKSILFQLEITERKAAKEEKQANRLDNSPYIYGKQNFFYPVKLGVQLQSVLGNKSNKNGVSITANYGGGLALGLIRPYLVQVNTGTTFKYVGYNSPDSNLFLNSPAGGPGFNTGWDKLTITPGLYVKTALRFDYGAYNEVVSALEVGLTGEFYSKKVPIMVRTPAKQFFFSAYAAIIFGKRR